MNRRYLLSALAIIVLVSGISTGQEAPKDPRDARRVPLEDLKDMQSVVESSNAFALDLYAAIREQDGNLFLSPFSISTALAMTYAGAAGVTEREMSDVLRFSTGQEGVHRGSGAVISSLNRGSESGRYDLLVANALWPQAGFEFLETYLSMTRDRYGAMLETLDYQNDPEGARLRINSWVEEKTKKKIKDLMPPRSVAKSTRLVLTNAIYFKGNWASQFDPDRTRPGPFKLADGTEADVPMMHQERRFQLLMGQGFKILGMPYEGKDLSMLIILPESFDGLPELERGLTWEKLKGWIGTLGGGEVRVAIPKFKMTSSFELTGVLAALGMPSAFGIGSADFSGMTGARDLYINTVVHKAFVEVNEEGTEAAAATGVGMILTSMTRETEFIADHPFLFLIRDDVTGSILFMGRVADPRS